MGNRKAAEPVFPRKAKDVDDVSDENVNEICFIDVFTIFPSFCPILYLTMIDDRSDRPKKTCCIVERNFTLEN